MKIWKVIICKVFSPLAWLDFFSLMREILHACRESGRNSVQAGDSLSMRESWKPCFTPLKSMGEGRPEVGVPQILYTGLFFESCVSANICFSTWIDSGYTRDQRQITHSVNRPYAPCGRAVSSSFPNQSLSLPEIHGSSPLGLGVVETIFFFIL